MSADRQDFGLEVECSQYRPRRGVIHNPEATSAGNIAVRCGLEVEDGRGWQQVAYAVLSIDEALDLAAELVSRAEGVRREQAARAAR